MINGRSCGGFCNTLCCWSLPFSQSLPKQSKRFLLVLLMGFALVGETTPLVSNCHLAASTTTSNSNNSSRSTGRNTSGSGGAGTNCRDTTTSRRTTRPNQFYYLSLSGGDSNSSSSAISDSESSGGDLEMGESIPDSKETLEKESLIASSSSSSNNNNNDGNDDTSSTSMSTPSPSSATSSTFSLKEYLTVFWEHFDLPLLLYFAFFYAGNYGYSVTNKLTLKASGGAAGFPLTISALQLGIGCLYGIFLWLAPDARTPPNISWKDVRTMIPIAMLQAGSHSASVFGYAYGSVSFVSIVKAAEPVFAALIAQFIYRTPVSSSKWSCLPVVILGVVLASVSEVNFSVMALFSACTANLIAAFRGNETKKLLTTAGLKERIGGAGNQFAITAILGFIMWAPLAYIKEGHKWNELSKLIQTTPTLQHNLLLSAYCYYGYNELRTVTLKKTSAVTGSVANTLKRLIVIIGVALYLGEPLGPLKLFGCMLGVGGVLLYSVVD